MLASLPSDIPDSDSRGVGAPVVVGLGGVASGRCAVCGDVAHHHQHYGAVCCYSCR